MLGEFLPAPQPYRGYVLVEEDELEVIGGGGKEEEEEEREREREREERERGERLVSSDYAYYDRCVRSRLGNALLELQGDGCRSIDKSSIFRYFHFKPYPNHC